MAAIECRPQEIVHCGVDHEKVLLFPFFSVEDAREKDACISGDQSSRFEHDLLTRSDFRLCTFGAEMFLDKRAILSDLGAFFALIRDPDAATQIEKLQWLGQECVDLGGKRFRSLKRIRERRETQELSFRYECSVREWRRREARVPLEQWRESRHARSPNLFFFKPVEI